MYLFSFWFSASVAMVRQQGERSEQRHKFQLELVNLSAIPLHPPNSARRMNPHPAEGIYCYEGNCHREPHPKVYKNPRSLRQHRVQAHAREAPQETSIGRALKRKREAEAEESRCRFLAGRLRICGPKVNLRLSGVSDFPAITC